MKTINVKKQQIPKIVFVVYPSGNENDKCRKTTNTKNCFVVYPSGNENDKC